jgi:LysM domain-containing protein
MSRMRDLRRLAAATLVAGTVAVVAACIPPSGRVGSPSGTLDASAAVTTPLPSPSGPSARPSFVRPTPTPLPTFLVYTVRPGDTLTAIARLFHTTARSIAFWNRANHPSLDPDSPTYAPDRIQAGWDLYLIPDVELDPEELPEIPTSTPTASSPGTSGPPTSGRATPGTSWIRAARRR